MRSSKVVLESPRLRELRKKKRRSLRRKVIVILVILFVLFIGCGFAARVPEVNIHNVVVVGNHLVETKDIESVTWNVLGGHYFGLYPKANVLIYPESKLKKEILNNLKRVETVRVLLNQSEDLVVSVTERGPKYLWCDMKDNCYFADEGGYIFDSAPNFTGGVYLKFSGGIDINREPIGQVIYPVSFAKFTEFAKKVRELGLWSTTVEIRESNEVKIYLSSNNETNPPYIIFLKDENTNKLAENLYAAINSEPLKSKMKEKAKDLEYIDLRFGNKVYYKFK